MCQLMEMTLYIKKKKKETVMEPRYLSLELTEASEMHVYYPNVQRIPFSSSH